MSRVTLFKYVYFKVLFID